MQVSEIFSMGGGCHGGGYGEDHHSSYGYGGYEHHYGHGDYYKSSYYSGSHYGGGYGRGYYGGRSSILGLHINI